MTPAEQRTGVALREPVHWHDLAQLARTAEETGYDALFVPESAGRDGFATLAALAAETTTVRLATGVVAITARRPQATAMAAATVQEASGGRFVLGVGAGFERSLRTVRDYVRQVRETELSFDPGPPPPVWLAALGDRMLGLAAEVADGVLLNWCTPERVARARSTLARGAEAAGRDPASLTVGVYVRACLEPEEDVALAALDAQARQYASLPHYRRQFGAMGLGGEAEAAAGGASDSLVRATCLLGDPRAAVERLQAYREAGADVPVVYPVPVLEPVSSLMGTILALAPAPALEA
jgi:probable F420-dependent oxidoreductase